MEDFGYNVVALILAILGIPADGFILRTPKNRPRLKRWARRNNWLRLFLLLLLIVFLIISLSSFEDWAYTVSVVIGGVYVILQLIAIVLVIMALMHSRGCDD